MYMTPEGPFWQREPETAKEQLYHFIMCLREVMLYLSENPIGKATEITTADVAKMLTQLPVRMALVRTGNTSTVVDRIQTDDTPPRVTGAQFDTRLATILDQTRKAFCRPREDVEGALRGATVAVTAPPSEIINEVDDEHENDPQATRPAADRWEDIE
jgi:hypothetical protein